MLYITELLTLLKVDTLYRNIHEMSMELEASFAKEELSSRDFDEEGCSKLSKL